MIRMPAESRRATLRKWRPTTLALALLLAPAASAWAQSLMEVYETARSYDATYLAAVAQARSVEYQARQSDALRLPTVGLQGNVTRQRYDIEALNNTQSNTQKQVALQAKQPLFNAGNTASINQAEQSLIAAQADLQIAEQDLMVRTAQAYFDVLAAQDALAAAQANKKAISEQLASAKRNFEVGNATITDTREAQARFDLATAQEISATNDLQTRRAALDQLVGRPGVEPRPLMSPVTLPQLTPGRLDDWVTQGQDSPNVRRARVALEVARYETDKARAGHLPTVDLVGTLSRTDNSAGSLGLGQVQGKVDAASIAVQANVPIFAGFAVQNRVRETLALAERAERNLDAARRSTELATRQAFLGVQSGLAAAQAYEAAEASTRLQVEATQLGYRVGVRVNLDVLNAQTQLYSTQRDLSRARYDVLVNSLRLRQTVGTLRPEDLAAVNQLLAK
ncbi:MAG: TolC family outer membrane protein [Aquabacterium sp.]|nr:TolC family outer membrane protein [Aquabacterium sp.]